MERLKQLALTIAAVAGLTAWSHSKGAVPPLASKADEHRAVRQKQTLTSAMEGGAGFRGKPLPARLDSGSQPLPVLSTEQKALLNDQGNATPGPGGGVMTDNEALVQLAIEAQKIGRIITNLDERLDETISDEERAAILLRLPTLRSDRRDIELEMLSIAANRDALKLHDTAAKPVTIRCETPKNLYVNTDSKNLRFFQISVDGKVVSKNNAHVAVKVRNGSKVAVTVWGRPGAAWSTTFLLPGSRVRFKGHIGDHGVDTTGTIDVDSL